jgi:ADP-heptose:LPS heptosyltransferase
MRQWKEFFNSFIVESSSSNLTNEESVSSFKQRKKEEIEKLEQKFKIEKSDREKVLYVMPMSFGDIVISTCIVDSLVKNRHHDCDFYFATKKDYFEVLDGLVETHGIKVIEYDDILINAEATREIWDYVYTPGINVQYNFSNWTLGNGKFGLNLFQEFAKNCNLTPLDITDYNLSLKECAIPSKNYVCLTAVSSKDSKTYKHWNDIIKNIKDMCPGMEVVQFGTKGENKLEGTLDYRGLTWNECLYVLKNSIAHIGPDTGMGHAAAALDVPHLVLFASTSPNQCAPQLINQTNLQLLIEPEENLCGKCHCYKDICVNKKGGINCISNIDPQTVCEALYLLFNKINDKIENPQKYAKLPVLNEAAFKDALKVIGDLKNVNNNQSQA